MHGVAGYLPEGWDLDRIKRTAGGWDFKFGNFAAITVRDESGRLVAADSIILHRELAIVHELGDGDEWSLGGNIACSRVDLWATYGSLETTLLGL